ncbi:ingression protein fic1 [Podospora aff. communis PSN243]|uniref:Ingression protein fic1 n=1 Tax=Podospora aff. communis PSN243 TaxID=3040156 RepID=A0AAV9GJ76_9PEZI|nr:ingression protein fic1 [Podospora aff. communis PSN243]
MASKIKTHPLNGMHTSGIFSDMTVDGPEIGTLVLVVDRAKNLPNRKTIGKQDPYCAARLGKEAKKTTTDIRGGQTPKWDQELRFIVHDSPDYYQLKVSVFNDDKKTELIGEAWIDLRDIIVTGGGQSDKWHQLACKGKYAGEVRIEITYYDTRPKPEKPVVKAKPQAAEPEAVSAPAAAGPRSMPKRRPLPSDPVTGKAPPSPVPDAVETPPRPQPNPPASSYLPSQSPLQQPDYSTPPPAPPAATGGRYQEPADPYGGRSPSGEFGTPTRRTDTSGQQYRTPDRSDQYQAPADDRAYSPHYQQPHHDRYDSRPQEQYDIPHHDHQRARSFEEDRPPPPPAHRTRTGSNPTMNTTYQSGSAAAMRHDVLRNEAHRQSATASYPGRPTYKAYDSAPAAPVNSHYSNVDQPSPPRHYSYDTSYDQGSRSMQATVEDVPESPDSIHGSWGRRRSFAPQSQSQPQLEQEYDLAASPAPLNLSGRREPAAPRYSNVSNIPDQHRRHDSTGYIPSPPVMSPRDISSQSAASRHFGRHSETSLTSYNSQPDQRASTYRNEMDNSPGPYDMPLVPASLVPGMDPAIAQEISDRFHQERNHQRRYTQPPPAEAPPRGRAMSEIPRRYDQDTSPGPYNSGPQSQSRGQLMYSGGPSTSSVNVVIKQRNYSPNPPRDPSPNPRHTIRRKSVSPAPPPTGETRRLSGVPFGPDSYDALNPAVATSAVREPAASRPDYDEATGKIITHDGREIDPSDHLPMESWAPEPEPKKPSNTTSATNSSKPSPQTTLPSSRAQRLAGRSQSSLPSSGVQYSGGPSYNDPATPSPPVSTGRNRLQKKAHRASITAGPVMSGAIPVMSGANGSGFSRSNGSDVGSSPLAPLPLHQDNFTPPRQLARASTYDYAGSTENYGPGYHGSGFSPAGNGRGPMPPSIPAKVPLALPAPQSHQISGALQLHSSSLAGRGDLDSWDYDERGRGRDMWGGNSSLEEELSRIDIGTGRSRRRGY